MWRRRAWTGALAALALSAGACSSGGSSDLASQSPTQILNAVKQAFSSASSVRVTGRVNQGSQSGSVDLTTFSNSDFSGTISYGGNTVQVVRIGNNDYLKASAGFYQAQGSPASEASLLGGKWVYGTNQQVGLGNDFTLSGLASQVTKPKPPVTKGATGTVDGQAAVALHSPDGTLWVATSGTAYPIEISQSGSSGGDIHFSAWNQGTAPTAPAGAINLNSVGSSG